MADTIPKPYTALPEDIWRHILHLHLPPLLLLADECPSPQSAQFGCARNAGPYSMLQWPICSEDFATPAATTLVPPTLPKATDIRVVRKLRQLQLVCRLFRDLVAPLLCESILLEVQTWHRMDASSCGFYLCLSTRQLPRTTKELVLSSTSDSTASSCESTSTEPTLPPLQNDTAYVRTLILTKDRPPFTPQTPTTVEFDLEIIARLLRQFPNLTGLHLVTEATRLLSRLPELAPRLTSLAINNLPARLDPSVLQTTLKGLYNLENLSIGGKDRKRFSGNFEWTEEYLERMLWACPSSLKGLHLVCLPLSSEMIKLIGQYIGSRLHYLGFDHCFDCRDRGYASAFQQGFDGASSQLEHLWLSDALPDPLRLNFGLFFRGLAHLRHVTLLGIDVPARDVFDSLTHVLGFSPGLKSLDICSRAFVIAEEKTNLLDVQKTEMAIRDLCELIHMNLAMRTVKIVRLKGAGALGPDVEEEVRGTMLTMVRELCPGIEVS